MTRALVALVPWLNVAVIAAMLFLFLLPRAGEGHVLASVAAGIVIVLALPMVAAAVAFTAEVVRGRYPPPEDR